MVFIANFIPISIIWYIQDDLFSGKMFWDEISWSALCQYETTFWLRNQNVFDSCNIFSFKLVTAYDNSFGKTRWTHESVFWKLEKSCIVALFQLLRQRSKYLKQTENFSHRRKCYKIQKYLQNTKKFLKINIISSC